MWNYPIDHLHDNACDPIDWCTPFIQPSVQLFSSSAIERKSVKSIECHFFTDSASADYTYRPISYLAVAFLLIGEKLALTLIHLISHVFSDHNNGHKSYPQTYWTMHNGNKRDCPEHKIKRHLSNFFMQVVLKIVTMSNSTHLIFTN